MTDLDHKHKDFSITNLVQNSVVADAYAVVGDIPGQLLASRRSRICAKGSDRVGNPDPDLRRQFEQFAAGCGDEFYLVPSPTISQAWRVLSL